MKFIRKTVLVLTIVLMSCCCGACSNEKPQKIKRVFDYVFDAGTYTKLDYDFADKWFKEHHDNYGGGCTAIATIDKNGDTIVGRNMDLYISHNAAYIVRTDVEGCYKTIGLQYTHRGFSPTYYDALENGLSLEFSKIMPFLADDVLNEKGLYVEVNMRNAEFWPDGEPKFSCQGTNPNGERRVYSFELPRYIGEHCATVDEAIEYVKTLDIYTQNGYWNYCFLIADASGHYGVLEIAADQLIWNDMQKAQANFYISDELAAIQELKAGVGRYDVVMDGIKDVQTEDDMYKLMDKVSYFQTYDPDNCQFDYCSEMTGALSFASYDIVTKPEVKEYIDTCMRYLNSYLASKTRDELRGECNYWESAFTEVINCNKKTLFVRFYEDDSTTLTLDFND